MSDGKVVVVTGGAGTIGLACAKRFTDHHVVLVDTSEERLESAAKELGDAGAEVSTEVCDVRDRDQVDAVAATAAEKGPLRALVHTAGFSGAQADAKTILEVNLGGTLRILDAFEGQSNDGAVAVVIASLGGHRSFTEHYDEILSTSGADDVLERLEGAGALGLHARAAYAISKRGVILQTQIRAAAWGAKKGRLVSVSPGLIGDSTMGALVGEGGAYADQAAIGRAGTTKEIAAVVAFLASSEAAYVTGTDILVDGGTKGGWNWHASTEDRLHWNGPPVVA
jgi:NAD(P)-dependent dehydrogenase (short-subunit alcohol dehydrogenase family)